MKSRTRWTATLTRGGERRVVSREDQGHISAAEWMLAHIGLAVRQGWSVTDVTVSEHSEMTLW